MTHATHARNLPTDRLVDELHLTDGATDDFGRAWHVACRAEAASRLATAMDAAVLAEAESADQAADYSDRLSQAQDAGDALASMVTTLVTAMRSVADPGARDQLAPAMRDVCARYNTDYALRIAYPGLAQHLLQNAAAGQRRGRKAGAAQ